MDPLKPNQEPQDIKKYFDPKSYTTVFVDSTGFKTQHHELVEHIETLKSIKVNSEDYHVINIFGIRADYVCKNKEACFSIKYDNIDSKKLNALVDEFEALYNADPQKR